MDQNQALQVINSAVRQSSDPQVSNIDRRVLHNLAEHLANVSRFVDVLSMDKDDLVKFLIYADQQRQQGFHDAMEGNGEMIQPQGMMPGLENNQRPAGHIGRQGRAPLQIGGHAEARHRGINNHNISDVNDDEL